MDNNCPVHGSHPCSCPESDKRYSDTAPFSEERADFVFRMMGYVRGPDGKWMLPEEKP